ncbi:MAG: PAS domain-containing protein, partial [Pseudomonadota bacterium]|nr:PAS domain-containing protein [Pseudomonadota bacterium]
MMDFLSKIEDDVLRRLYIYWDKCRGKRLFPARSDLDPVDFPYALGHIILLDVLQGNGPQFMVRLFGTWHAHRKGFDLTGRSIADDPDPINSARLQTVLEATLQHETPARFVSEFV